MCLTQEIISLDLALDSRVRSRLAHKYLYGDFEAVTALISNEGGIVMALLCNLIPCYAIWV